MPGAFGSSGYTPEGTENQGNLLNSVLSQGMGLTIGERGKAQAIKDYGSIDNFNKYLANMSPQEKAKYEIDMPSSPSQNFTYKPGESGYNFASQYTPTTFKADNVANQAEPYYAGIKSNMMETAKGGMQSGLDMAQGMMGRRGIGRSGIANNALGNVVDSTSRTMADQGRQIDFGRAQDYNQLNQFNAGLGLQAQNMTDQSKQFGESARQKGLAGQQTSDQTFRGEKFQYSQSPLQQMMALYGANMGAPGNQAQQGWLSPMLGGAGSAMTGFGSIYNGK